MRGFIDDDGTVESNVLNVWSQSAFMRGFIDDPSGSATSTSTPSASQSAFMRGFIDDLSVFHYGTIGKSMSQSAFMRGFIDDDCGRGAARDGEHVSIRVHARLHR